MGDTAKAEEERFSRSNGKTDWIRWEMRPWHETSGKIGGVILFSELITARKIAEDALREREALFRTTLYSIGDGVITTDKYGNVDKINHIAEKLTGRKEDEAKDKSLEEIFKIVNEDTGIKVDNPLKKILGEGKIIGLENHTILISKDGREVPIAYSGASIRDEKGNIIGIVIVFRDQTKERESQRIIEDTLYQLKQSQKVARVGYYNFDIDSGIWESSEMLDELFGIDKYYRRNIEGWINLVHPDQQSEMLKYLDKHVLKDNLEFNKEYRIINKKNKMTYWVHGIGNLEFSQSGNPVKMFGTIQDITDRKLAEFALRETEEKWESLFEYSPNAIAVYKAVDNGKDFMFTDFNHAASQLDKIKREDVIGRKLTEVFPGSEKFGLLEKLNQVILSGKHERMDIKYYSDGRIEGWRDNIFYKLKTGEIVAIYSDVTKRITAEIALRESEQKFRNIVQTANEGIIISDHDYVITFANRALGEMLGYPPEELIGKNLKDFILDSEYDDFENKMMRRSSGKHDVFERKYRRKDGAEVIGLVSAVSLTDEENNFSGSLGMISDITEMKKAELELRESEERFRTVYSASPLAISITEIKTGKLVEVNDAYKKLFGFSNEEIRGKSTTEIGVWSNEKDRHKIINLLSKYKYFDNVEFTLRTKSGSLITCLTAGRIIKINNSEYLLAMVNDITLMKKAESELRESEERFRTLFEDNGAPMLLIAPADGKIIGVNSATLDFYGWTKEVLLNKTIDRIDIMDAVKLKNILGNTFTNKQHHFETKHRLADGTLRDVEIICSSLIMKGSLYEHLIVHDITSRKQAEEKVQLLAHAVETTEEGITIMDLHNNILFVNDAFADIFGYSEKELVGQNMKMLHSSHPVNPEYDLIFSNSIQSGWTGEFVSTKKDGTDFNIYLSTSPVKDENNVTYAVVGIIMDITERVKREEELENYRHNLEEQVKQRTHQLNDANVKLREQLRKEKELEIILKKSLDNEKELNEIKTRFISTASHEFRTPLTAVFSSAELIQRYGRKWNEEKLGEHVRRIKNSVDYITQLLDEVLTISRVESGRINYSPEKLNLPEFCRELIKEVQPLSKDNHMLIFNYQPEEKYFYLDSKLMKFILINLLSNAIKYSPHGGKVELTVENSGKFLIFKIEDEGIGIPEKDKSQLFEPFYRCSNAGEIPGTGLGLSIVSQSVELHGGSVSVNSRLGMGSVFTVQINIDDKSEMEN